MTTYHPAGLDRLYQAIKEQAEAEFLQKQGE